MYPSLLSADISIQSGDAIAKPGTASVVLGASVRIPLVAVRPASTQPVKFRITSPPKFGQLSAVVPDPADTGRAWVMYTPNADAPPGKDQFNFNAKLEGKIASPSATIVVKLENPVAVLSVDPVLPFGQVEVGTVRKLPLKIRNTGTKTFTSTLKPPAPWSIPNGQQELVVEAGGETTVEVQFAPINLKPAKYLLVLQVGNLGGVVQLTGAGSSPFGKQFGTLELAWDDAADRRQASFRLANLTDRELPLRISAPPRLEVEGLLVLEAKQVVKVPVSIGGIETYRGELTIASEHHEERLPVYAKPTPAKIRVLKPQERVFEFELMDTDTPPVYEVVVTNEGGRKAFIYGETSRPFYVVEGGDPAEIGSGEQLTIKVSMDPREVGTYERNLSILGTANKIEFQLTAAITRDVDRTKVGVNLPDLAPLITAHQAQLLDALPDYKTRLFGLVDKKRVTQADVPTVQKIYLEERGKRKLVFSWDHPGSADLDYVLEYEVYTKEEGRLPQPIWYMAEEHVKVEKDDKSATMTLSKLQPGRQFRMRILTVDKDGHFSKPSRAVLVHTLPPTRKPLWLIVPFFLVAGGGGLYVWRRRQQI